MREESKLKYEELFSSVELKASAFDIIAEKYYMGNFGSVSKSDFDVLMFSIYLERILEANQNNFTAYSDYTLSKLLGLTQSKIGNLKVKKELIYPYKDFNWRDSLLVISDNAVYEDEKIKLFVPDKNLFIEIKNAIEETGGYVEIQLTPNLLQVRPAYFLDLMVAVSDSSDRSELIDQIKRRIEENNENIKCIEKQPFGKVLINQTPDLVIDIISDCVPIFGNVVGEIAKKLLDTVRESRKINDSCITREKIKLKKGALKWEH